MNAARKLVALASLTLPLAALAQAVSGPPGTAVIDQRQMNQEARIQQGVNSGALTSREAARLEQGQAHVQRMENRAKADGVVTARESQRLNQAQNVQSRRIYRQKHDPQHDFNHDGRMDRPLADNRRLR